MGEPLVSQDDPIFDKRFKDLKYKDIDLSSLWTEVSPSVRSEPVSIHNRTIAELADRVRHGVVNLYTKRLEEKKAKFGISPNDLLPFKIPVFSALFDIIPFHVPIPFRTEGLSLGSGFIIHKDGYILSNAHVVYNATDIRVVLSEGQQDYPAKIIGMDRVTDTALLKMEGASDLKPLPLGDSDTLLTGEMVVAMGNPLGLKHSVTMGIVSAKERVAPQLNENLVDFIQTDSAINPGNSGGPLLNLHGEVVGINTALLAKAQSIGFAIPVNTVKEVMSLLVLGQTERGWFGAKAAPLSKIHADALRFPHEGGVLITEVEKDSPADKAGLKPRDIIMSLNGEQLTSFILFRRKLLGLAPGREVNLTLFRDGETRRITATLISREKKQSE
jgi:serine protease Do